MAATVLSGLARPRIGVVELDIAVSEQHTSRATVTSHPLDSGGKITDHVRQEPDTLTLEGLISNTPIDEDMRTQAGDVVPGDAGRAETAYAALLRMKEAGELVTIATGLRVYQNMIVTRVDVPRGRDTGEALRFSATAEQVRVVQSRRVAYDVRTEIPRGKPTVNGGKKVTESAGTPPRYVSKLREGADAIGLLQKTGKLLAVP